MQQRKVRVQPYQRSEKKKNEQVKCLEAIQKGRGDKVNHSHYAHRYYMSLAARATIKHTVDWVA